MCVICVIYLVQGFVWLSCVIDQCDLYDWCRTRTVWLSRVLPPEVGTLMSFLSPTCSMINYWQIDGQSHSAIRLLYSVPCLRIHQASTRRYAGFRSQRTISGRASDFQTPISKAAHAIDLALSNSCRASDYWTSSNKNAQQDDLAQSDPCRASDC